MKTTPYLGRPAILLMLALAVFGCAGQPFDPPKTDEIPEGPGIFTDNAEGALVIRVGEDDRNSPAASATATSSTDAVPSMNRGDDFAEFEAYQEWLEWKRSAKGTPEYEEFQQWREWRRYREWKQQN